MLFRKLVALCALAATLSGCFASTNYAEGELGLDQSSRAAARQANLRIEQALGEQGDFRPGDLVRISFPFLPTLDADQRVQPTGVISPPLLDPIQVRGLTTGELQQRLERLYRPKLERPVVAVALVEYNERPAPPEFFVIGEVIRPGAVPWREGTTLLEAIARAGGANRQAKLSTVVLVERNGDEMVARLIDVQGLLAQQGAREMPFVGPLSVVIVPPTNLALSAERSETIRRIIGFTGFGTGFRIGLGGGEQ